MPPDTVPDANKLTLTQAIEIGLRQNPQVTVARHQVAGSVANLAGQRAPLNPLLSVTGTTHTTGTLDPADPSKYGVLYTFETSGRRGLRTAQAKAQLLGAQADALTTSLTVRWDVASAYITLQVANSQYENARSNFETAKRLSDLTEQQVTLGAAPEANALRARIGLTQAEQALLRAGSEVRLDRANLNLQLGRNATDAVDAADPLIYHPVVLKPEDLERAALANRPEIRSAEAAGSALQAAVKIEKSQHRPDLVLGVNPRALVHGQVELGVVLPLLDLGSIRGSVRRAEEDVRAQEAQTETERQRVRLEVQAAYLDLLRSQRLVESYQGGILPRAQSLLSRIELGYQLGASSILELMDAQQTLRSTRNDYYQALGDHGMALAQLSRSIGGPLPEVAAPVPAAAPAQGGTPPSAPSPVP
jgi:cobalt-zinc-cadmium efflux system outer membrane protein